MEIEIKSTQMIDNKKETMIQKAIGSIKRYEKGIKIIWNSSNESTNFEMIIVQDKILLKKPNQTMVFELGKTTTSVLQMPYGSIHMYITTNYLEIVKQNEMIDKIILEYEIKLENTIPYQNQIEMIIK